MPLLGRRGQGVCMFVSLTLSASGHCVLLTGCLKSTERRPSYRLKPLTLPGCNQLWIVPRATRLKGYQQAKPFTLPGRHQL